MSVKRYRCLLCRTPENPFGTDFESADPQCPTCKASGELAVAPVEVVHLYAPDQANGPVVGMHGRRYRVACKPNATNPRGVPCSADPRAVNCPDCLKAPEYKKALDTLQATAGGEIL